MTQRQYEEVCEIFKRKLSDEELKDMGMTPNDGEFDEALQDDIVMYRIDMRRQGR